MTITELINSLNECLKEYGNGNIYAHEIFKGDMSCIEFYPLNPPNSKDFPDHYYDHIDIIWQNDNN